MRTLRVINLKVIALLSVFLSSGLLSMAGNDPSRLSQQHFLFAKSNIEAMLAGKEELSYEKAVFLTENAYWDNAVTFNDFRLLVDWHTARIRQLLQANDHSDSLEFHPLPHETIEAAKERYRKAIANWAIFTYMTDTTFFVIDSNQVAAHLPYSYSRHDPLGTNDWGNTQVLSLLHPFNHSGNCYALASLFKIFANRMQTEAWLATTPGHIYIVHADEKGTLYNIDLGSRSFPGTGSLQTVTYTTNQAIQGGIAMDNLDENQSVALCLVYLAKGYEHKFKRKDDDFVMQCAETALHYDRHNLQAMLLKAQVLEERIIKLMAEKGIADIDGLRVNRERSALLETYESLLAELYDLGYREMPEREKEMVLASIQQRPFIHQANHDSQPFINIGMKTRSASLSGGLFEEAFENEKEEKIGRTIFETGLKKVLAFHADELVSEKVLFGLSVDPLTSSYPWYSPYQFAGNKPIKYIDLEGLQEFDPSQYQYFAPELIRIAKTTFYDTKHSIANLFLNTLVPNDPGMKWEATYTTNEDGVEIFETVIRQVPEQGFWRDALGYGLDGLNLLGLKGGIQPSDFISVKTGTNTQISRTLREFLDKTTTIKAKLNAPQPAGKTFDYEIVDGKIKFKDSNIGDGRHDFVITKEGDIKIGEGHYHLSGGADEVYGAGELTISNGKFVAVDNNSGHYKPNTVELINQAIILKNSGAGTGQIDIRDVTK